MSDQDRALLSPPSQKAEQAKTMAQQALDASRAAQASAAQSAKAANEKADRVFQRSLRKMSRSQ